MYFPQPVCCRNGASEGKVDALLEVDGIVLEDEIQRLALVHAAEADLLVVVTSEVAILNSGKQIE